MLTGHLTENIKALSTDHVTPEIVRQLRPIVSDPEFQPENVAAKSKAAASLCSFVLAVFCHASNANRV